MQRALTTITTRSRPFRQQLRGPSTVLRALPALRVGTLSLTGKQLSSLPTLYSCYTTTTTSSIPKPSRNLRNPGIFPPYDQLPSEYDIQARPKYHWCFLSEIQHLSWFLRLRIDVQDLYGMTIPVYFYTPDRGGAVVEEAKRGYTLALFYAGRRLFMDGQIGVRVENATSVKVIPYSLKELLVANDAAALTLDQDKRPRIKAPHGAIKEVMWFMNRDWEDVGEAGRGRIHLRGADPVRPSNKLFTDQDQEGFREKLGMFPPLPGWWC